VAITSSNFNFDCAHASLKLNPHSRSGVSFQGLEAKRVARREMGHHEPIRKAGAGISGSASEIPDKLYFRIGEVARLCEVPTYVLRFWESEFPQLKPNKGGTGQRLYRRRDVEMALRVKTLLYDEGYTIPGARTVLKSEFRQKEPQLALPGAALPNSDAKRLRTLRRELEAIAALLARPAESLSGSAKPAAAKALVHPIRAPRRASTPARIEMPEIPFDSAE
jgi:DNA-binding transcriptional MerR regulator